MMAQTRLLLGFPLTPDWLDGFVFGGTVFGYHYANPKPSYRLVAWIMGVLGGICLLVAAPLQIGAYWIRLFPPLLFWLAYYGFLHPKKTKLRDHPLAKPMVIAATWAWVSVLLPSPFDRWPDLFFMGLGRAAFIFALALAYDLSDAAHDQKLGLKTLVGSLGPQQTYVWIDRSLALAGLCVAANLWLHLYDYALGIGLIGTLAFTAFWLRKILSKPDWEYWHKPLIDGLMVLQFLVIWLLYAT